MKKNTNLLLTILILILSINIVKADCTPEEEKQLLEEVEKVELVYKHLGEVTKEDGSKVYNEYKVTAKNIPNEVYIYLYPFADEKFEETSEGPRITLKTGTWYYNMYSSKCDKTLKTITLTLPKFNMYSLDPLCDKVDTEDFKYCHKYYQNEISRETFERKVKAYRLEHHLDDKEIPKQEKENILKPVIDFLLEYYIYIIIGIVVIVTISALIIRINKKKRTVLK